MTVPQDSPAAGHELRSLRLPSSVNLALVVRGEQNITPTGDTIIEAGDRLFALVTADGEAALRDTILTA